MSLRINKRSQRPSRELLTRSVVSIALLTIYVVGGRLPLFPAGEYIAQDNIFTFLAAIAGGSTQEITVFTLGLIPFFNASIIAQIFLLTRSREYRRHMSKSRLNRIIFVLSFLFAGAYSVLFMMNVRGLNPGEKILATVVLISGSAVVHVMATRNDTYGIGNASIFILAGLIPRFLTLIAQYNQLIVGCAIVSLVMLVLEVVVIRFPMQRISVHSIFARNDYLAVQLAPTGVMPIMFASSLASVFVPVVRILLPAGMRNFAMHTALIILILVLSVITGFLFLNPGDMSDQMKETGDSIVGVPIGEKTRSFLRRKLIIYGLISGAIQSGTIAVIIAFSYRMAGDSTPAMQTLITAMMISGLFYNLVREGWGYYHQDSYRFFAVKNGRPEQ